MQITIERAKLVKRETLEVTFTKTEKDKTGTKVSETHKSKAHADLVSAYDGLNIHLGIMCGYIKAKDVRDITAPNETEGSENFTASSVSFGGEEGKEGVVVTGHVKLANGKTVTLNTPFTRFEEDEKTRYAFMDDLVEKLDQVKSEVAQYLGGKVAPDPQGDLFEPGQTTTNNGEKATKAKIAKPAEKKLFKSDEGTEGGPAITQDMVDKEMEQHAKKELEKGNKGNKKARK